jgi:hypothetical protein
MRIFYFISGLLFCFGSIFLFEDDYSNLDTYYNGEIVYVKVIEVPNCISGKEHYYFKFEYEGKLYSKDIGGALCDEIETNSIMKLKVNKVRTVFLYPDENPLYDMIAALVLFLFGMFMFIKGFRINLSRPNL